MLSTLKWYPIPFGVGVLTILNDQNGIFYLKIAFFTKNLPIFTKKLDYFAKNLPFFTFERPDLLKLPTKPPN